MEANRVPDVLGVLAVCIQKPKKTQKKGLFNSSVQKIYVDFRNDQMLKVTALKFKS